MKQQKDGWLDASREPTLKILILASFYQSSIGDQSLSILHDPRKESRLGLDDLIGLDCRPDGW